jgi:RNA recognition motif-containing protein
VFIGNLSWNTNNEQLFEFVSQIGTVLSAEVQRYEDTNRSKGWG